ncbi:head maturation protease, ClpP-related [Pseudomonas nitroreducens]|uniref:head maturation protease, ClpP-related n=1 Tax=Pseudomonas nitroreducens TaxID=46680 RepID=UPI00031BE54C|nr:head maturation protease, ClpP-related [Pseudomonas nitroreducens]
MTTTQRLRIFNKVPGAPIENAQHWYSIKARAQGSTDPTEVYVYGEIGVWGITANDFIRDLVAADDGTSQIVVAFNTIGGDLFDGLAIHNALRRLGARGTARIDSLAASAGSVAACGAHRVVMASNAMMMIHNPWTFAAGDAEDLRKTANALDQALEAIVAAYKSKATDIEDAELRRMINEETWLTASEAKAMGFADEIGEGVEVSACIGAGNALRRYHHPPKALLAQLDPPADPAPDPVPDPPSPNDPPAPTDQPPQPDPVKATVLALKITNACAAAKLQDVAPIIIEATQLRSDEAVDEALTRARAINDLCVAARLPSLTAEFVQKGLSADAVRAELFNKVVGKGKGSGFEINNTIPPGNDPTPPAQINPTNIWKNRQAAIVAAQTGAKP